MSGKVRVVTLHKTGEEWLALCPFHAGNTPKLVGDLVRGCFECEECGAKGGVHLHYMTGNGSVVARIEKIA